MIRTGIRTRSYLCHSYGMPHDRPHFRVICLARVRKIDLVVTAHVRKVGNLALRLGEFVHGRDGRGFVVVGAHMHALHAEALVHLDEAHG